MSFLSPWLLFGALGVAVPILVHLLSRYRHRRLEWAAMELLRRAVHVKTRRIRLEDLLLLLLRCLAVLLVALALARPTTRGGSALGEPGAGVVVALDGSMSMRALADGESRFDHALDKTRDILQTARPGDPTSLILMAAAPRVLLRNVGYQPDRIDRALADLQARPETLNLEAALEEAADMLDEMTAPNTELHLVTDAQRSTWANLSERSRRTLQTLAREHRLFIVPVRDDAVENLAVTDFHLASGSLRQGEIVRFTARVANLGNASRSAVRVSLLEDGRTVDRAFISAVAPGETAAVPFFHRPAEPGPSRLVARVERDRLDADNARFAAVHVRQNTRVLVADGDPFDAGRGGAADFIARALAPDNPSITNSLSVSTAPWLNLPSLALDRFDLLVLANVPDLPEVTADALRRFVRRGGGLIVYLGDNVRPAVLNQRLNREPTPLLPAELLRVATHGFDRDDAARLDPDVPAHPIVDVLASFPQETLADSRFLKHMAVAPRPGARALLRLDNGDPLLLEHRFGRGGVLLFTSSADRSWNDFALSPLSPALLHQAAAHLLRRPHEQPLTVGQRFVLPLVDTPADRPVEIARPGQPPQQLRTSLDGDRVVIDSPGLEEVGFYEVAVDDQPPWPLAVNPDPAESDLRAADPAELAAALGDLGLAIVEPDADLARAIQQSRIGRELWKHLLAAALLVLLLESIVAKRYARRPKG